MFESRFQSFAAQGDPSHGAARVNELRAELAREGLAGFIVPRADEHQNEYVPAGAERLRWLTGFAGSAGLAVVLKDSAALFVDAGEDLIATATHGTLAAIDGLVLPIAGDEPVPRQRQVGVEHLGAQRVQRHGAQISSYSRSSSSATRRQRRPCSPRFRTK